MNIVCVWVCVREKEWVRKNKEMEGRSGSEGLSFSRDYAGGQKEVTTGSEFPLNKKNKINRHKNT